MAPASENSTEECVIPKLAFKSKSYILLLKKEECTINCIADKI